ncbi:hypothetical protein GCM10009837_51100 [Streptomyces durmitorensis]
MTSRPSTGSGAAQQGSADSAEAAAESVVVATMRADMANSRGKAGEFTARAPSRRCSDEEKRGCGKGAGKPYRIRLLTRLLP